MSCFATPLAREEFACELFLLKTARKRNWKMLHLMGIYTYIKQEREEKDVSVKIQSALQ